MRQADLTFFDSVLAGIEPVFVKQRDAQVIINDANVTVTLHKQPPSPQPLPTITLPATGTPVASAPVATPGR